MAQAYRTLQIGYDDERVVTVPIDAPLKMPSKRLAYRADAQGNAIRDQLMVSIDLSDICFG